MKCKVLRVRDARLVLGLLVAATVSRLALCEAALDHIAQGKLETDLGNYGVASTHFAAAADDTTATAATRWEALVRLGLVRQALSDLAGSATAFDRLLHDYGQDPEAVRYLVESATGLTFPEGRWQQIRSSVRVTVQSKDPSSPLLQIDWPEADTEACRMPGHSAILSLDFKDAVLTDVFHFFTDFTGVPFQADPCLAGMTITIRRYEADWGELLRTIVGAYGLSCTYDPKQGFTINCGRSSIERTATQAERRNGEAGSSIPTVLTDGSQQTCELPPNVTFPTSFHVKGATLADLAQIFATASGGAIEVDPCVAKIRAPIFESDTDGVTREKAEKLFRRALAIPGIVCSSEGGTLHITCVKAGPPRATSGMPTGAGPTPDARMVIADFELQGITMSGTERNAIVSGPDGKGYNLTEGQRLADGVVETIAKDRVIFLAANGTRVVRILTPER